MGKASRDKGARRERELAALLPGAQKISGYMRPGPDLLWRGRMIEVKARSDGFKQLYGWLADAQLLAVKADRRPWLIVLEIDELLDLLDE